MYVLHNNTIFYLCVKENPKSSPEELCISFLESAHCDQNLIFHPICCNNTQLPLQFTITASTQSSPSNGIHNTHQKGTHHPTQRGWPFIRGDWGKVQPSLIHSLPHPLQVCTNQRLLLCEAQTWSSSYIHHP